MSFIIAGVLEVAGVVKRNSKIVFFLFLFFMWMLFWGNQTSPDHQSYKWMYQTISGITVSLDVEIGFQATMLLAKYMGMSSVMYFAIFGLIAYLLIARFILEYSENPAFVLCLYFLYPFLLDAEQKRSFMGTALVLFGFRYLIKGTKRGMIQYAICCIVAAMFQISCIIFLIFLAVAVKEKNVYKIAFGATVATASINIFLPIINKVLPAFAFQKLLRYLSKFQMKNIISICFFLIIIVMGIWGSRHLMEYADEKQKKFYEVCIHINVLSISFLPLVYLADDFTRLPRTILVMDYIVYANYIKKKITKRKQLLVFALALGLVGSRFLAYFLGAGMESYIIPFFVEGLNF